jgi:hypothetical protein
VHRHPAPPSPVSRTRLGSRHDRARLPRLPRPRRRGARGPRAALRPLLFGVCFVLLAWTWWDARADRYSGLAINTLGQIIGDVLLMGLIAPIGNRRRLRVRGDDPELTEVIARARHRIQLLDLSVCLEAGLPPAVAAALDHDVCVEILLPEPDAPDVPEDYPRCLRRFLDALAAESAAVSAAGSDTGSGRLDIRLYRGPAAVSVVRCDGRIWASLHPGKPTAATYLALDRDSENARTLQAYFDRLHAAARLPGREPREDPVLANTGPRAAVPPGEVRAR